MQTGVMAEPPRPQLILVRHGETEWSRERRHTGRTDVALTEHGRAQARHIATAVESFHFTHSYASPLSRALETAHLVGLDPDIEPDLREWDYGRYEGITTAQIRETDPGWSVWTHPVLDGESIGEVGARVDRLLHRLLELDGHIALVAHAHVLRVLGARWLGLDAVEGRRFALDTATMSILGWERENRVVLRWNDPCGWG
jgi:probable phosphoglycerate mutase